MHTRTTRHRAENTPPSCRHLRAFDAGRPLTHTPYTHKFTSEVVRRQHSEPHTAHRVIPPHVLRHTALVCTTMYHGTTPLVTVYDVLRRTSVPVRNSVRNSVSTRPMYQHGVSDTSTLHRSGRRGRHLDVCLSWPLGVTRRANGRSSGPAARTAPSVSEMPRDAATRSASRHSCGRVTPTTAVRASVSAAGSREACPL